LPRALRQSYWASALRMGLHANSGLPLLPVISLSRKPLQACDQIAGVTAQREGESGNEVRVAFAGLQRGAIRPVKPGTVG